MSAGANGAASSSQGSPRYMPIRQRTIGQAQEARLLLARARELQRRGAAVEALVVYDMLAGFIEGLPPGEFHADLYRWKGSLLRELGETARADALFRRSLDISHYVLYATGVAHAQNCLATLCQRRGDMCMAHQLYGDASLNAAAAGDQRLYALVEENLATLAMLQGDLEGARIRFHMGLRAFQATGDEEGTAWALNNIGLLHLHNERYGDAAGAFEQALEVAHARDDRAMDGQIALGRARLLMATGRLQEAAAECDRAVTTAQQYSARPRKAEALIVRSRIEREVGELESAIASAREAHALAQESEDVLAMAASLVELGDAWLLRAESQHAHNAWQQALHTFTKVRAVADIEKVEQRISTLGVEHLADTPE
jgi:tetratricopeptide (TPR) repeat protein